MDSTVTRVADGTNIHGYRVDAIGAPKAHIHIAHGMGEHAARYVATMATLAAAGYRTTANDHRGHGKTATVLGDFGPDGINNAVSDLQALLDGFRQEAPELPLVLFGHSMGAMLAQQFMSRHGACLDALVLSGTPGMGLPLMTWITHQIIRVERWRHGPTGESPLLDKLTFGSNNKPFDDTPDATGFEWLSRDRDQVRRYVDDPLCGFVPNTAGLHDLVAAERVNWSKTAVMALPQQVPVYLFSGSEDPVHGELSNIKRLLERYRSRGINVTTRFYEGGRHEMLNETNRDEVISDLLHWLEATLPGSGAQSQRAASSP